MAKNILNPLQSARLVNYIEKNYVLFGLSDPAFAKKASEELNIYAVTSHIVTRRELLGIKPNYERVYKKNDDSAVLQEYMAALEKRVTALEFELAAMKNRPFDAAKK